MTAQHGRERTYVIDEPGTYVIADEACGREFRASIVRMKGDDGWLAIPVDDYRPDCLWGVNNDGSFRMDGFHIVKKWVNSPDVGREKAEEWLRVVQDFADDLLVSHGEEAVEEFWGRLDTHFAGRRCVPVADVVAAEMLAEYRRSEKIRAEAWAAVRRVWPNAS